MYVCIGILLPISISVILPEMHAILHQADEFHPNETTYCENMTKYLDSRLRYNYRQTKFRRHVSIHC